METGINKQRILKLPYGHFDPKSISYFPYRLRGLGLRILETLNSTLKEQRDQFIISAIVSNEEIAFRDTEVIKQAEREWESRNSDSLGFDHYSVSFNRLVFILNHPNTSTHGEARLLDPDGTIRRQILDRPYQKKNGKESSNKFLAVMKEQFVEQFEDNEKYVLVIFSHYIPCTLPGHMCSDLLSEYATRNDEQIIIGYNNVYLDTDQNFALRLMNKSDNIHCIKQKDLKLKRRKNALEKRHEHEEESALLERYLFDHVDDEDYLNFKRMNKRFKNRSSKTKNRNREIENRIHNYSRRGNSSANRYDDSYDDFGVLEYNPDC